MRAAPGFPSNHHGPACPGAGATNPIESIRVKKNTAPKVIPLEPSEDDIRECAYRIYVQSGCIPGRDLENWLDAKSQLEAKLTAQIKNCRARNESARRAARKTAAGRSALAS